jgi:sugar phosphate isomerase/epimerase
VQPQIVLTLSVGSIRGLLAAGDRRCPNLHAVPGFARQHLGLRGLNVPASMLAGLTAVGFEKLRDAADKAGCPFVVLVDEQPLPFADPDPAKAAGAAERLNRLAAAANRLGCRDVAIRCGPGEGDPAMERTAAGIKGSMLEVERHDLNVLVCPGDGWSSDPDRLATLIKRVGGFRIGSLPSFRHAHASGDAEKTLRKLAPYAESIDATVFDFDPKGIHRPYDLAAMVAAVRAVGYVNTLAVEHAGKGDPVAAIERARTILEAAIVAELA